MRCGLLNTTIEDICEELIRDVNAAPRWDDWDAGYIAGLNRAIKLIEEVYGQMDRGET